ncbi:MAG: hypothetical protein ACXAAH_11610 [Promethearchaeota archaeon]|jgi:hypothetical protein
MKLNNQRSRFIIIGLLSIIVVFFVPFGYHVDLGPGPNSLYAMIWEVPLEPAWYSIRFFIAFQYRFEYCFFRIFFLPAVFLFFIGKINEKLFILVGIISEIIPLIISIPASFILNSQGDNLIPIIWPIPFLLIFDLIMVRYSKRDLK